MAKAKANAKKAAGVKAAGGKAGAKKAAGVKAGGVKAAGGKAGAKKAAGGKAGVKKAAVHKQAHPEKFAAPKKEAAVPKDAAPKQAGANQEPAPIPEWLKDSIGRRGPPPPLNKGNIPPLEQQEDCTLVAPAHAPVGYFTDKGNIRLLGAEEMSILADQARRAGASTHLSDDALAVIALSGGLDQAIMVLTDSKFDVFLERVRGTPLTGPGALTLVKEELQRLREKNLQRAGEKYATGSIDHKSRDGTATFLKRATNRLASAADAEALFPATRFKSFALAIGTFLAHGNYIGGEHELREALRVVEAHGGVDSLIAKKAGLLAFELTRQLGVPLFDGSRPAIGLVCNTIDLLLARVLRAVGAENPGQRREEKQQQRNTRSTQERGREVRNVERVKKAEPLKGFIPRFHVEAHRDRKSHRCPWMDNPTGCNQEDRCAYSHSKDAKLYDK